MRRVEEAVGGLAVLFMGGVLLYQFLGIFKDERAPEVRAPPSDGVAPFIPPEDVPYVPLIMPVVEPPPDFVTPEEWEYLRGPYEEYERGLEEKYRLAAAAKAAELAEAERRRLEALAAIEAETRRLQELAEVEVVDYPDVERRREERMRPAPVVAMPMVVGSEQEIIERRLEEKSRAAAAAMAAEMEAANLRRIKAAAAVEAETSRMQALAALGEIDYPDVERRREAYRVR